MQEARYMLRGKFCGLLLASVLIFSFFSSGCVKKPPESRGPEDVQPQVTYIYHKVKYPGETLAVIAAWYTGVAKNWQIIQAHNPGMDVRRIRIGDVILIPRDLVVKETPLPAEFVQKAARRPPKTEPKPTEEKVVTAEEVQEKTIPGELLERAPDAATAEGNVAASAAATEPATALSKETTPQPRVSEGVAPLAVGGSPFPTVAPTPERRLKTRDELLKELLEE